MRTIVNPVLPRALTAPTENCRRKVVRITAGKTHYSMKFAAANAKGIVATKAVSITTMAKVVHTAEQVAVILISGASHMALEKPGMSSVGQIVCQ